MSNFIGKTVSGVRKVQLVKQLGEGTFSFVFLGKDSRSGGGEFAVKRLSFADSDSKKVVERETEVLSMLQNIKHPNLIEFHEKVEIATSARAVEVWLIMEYCSQGSLHSIMNERVGDSFSENELLRVFSDMCEAVGVLHTFSNPITHRDLKVENVLRSSSGDFKLCDFGSATTKVLRVNEASKKEIVEMEEEIQKFTTMAYRSPEMVDIYSFTEIGTKCDMWALGCALYKIAFFEGPFDNIGPAGIRSGDFKFPTRSKYSNSIHSLISSLLTVDPASRPDIFETLEIISSLRKTKSTLLQKVPKRKADGARSPPNQTSTPNQSRLTSSQNQSTQAAPSTPRNLSRSDSLLLDSDWENSSSVPKLGQSEITIIDRILSNDSIPSSPSDIESILLWLYSGGSMGEIYNEVSKKALKESAVSWKSLIFIHNLIQQGPQSVIQHSSSQLKLFQNMSSFWSSKNGGLERSISKYANFIAEKIKFHSSHSIFEGNYSLQSFLEKHPIISNWTSYLSPVSNQSILDEFTLLAFILKELQPLVIQDQISRSSLLTLIREAHCIFLSVTFSIYVLIQMKGNVETILKYYGSCFPMLTQFYQNCGSVIDRSLIPQLPSSIPSFHPLPPSPPFLSAPSLRARMMKALEQKQQIQKQSTQTQQHQQSQQSQQHQPSQLQQFYTPQKPKSQNSDVDREFDGVLNSFSNSSLSSNNNFPSPPFQASAALKHRRAMSDQVHNINLQNSINVPNNKQDLFEFLSEPSWQSPSVGVSTQSFQSNSQFQNPNAFPSLQHRRFNSQT